MIEAIGITAIVLFFIFVFVGFGYLMLTVPGLSDRLVEARRRARDAENTALAARQDINDMHTKYRQLHAMNMDLQARLNGVRVNHAKALKVLTFRNVEHGRAIECLKKGKANKVTPKKKAVS